jgi:hypothetical protein
MSAVRADEAGSLYALFGNRLVFREKMDRVLGMPRVDTQTDRTAQ